MFSKLRKATRVLILAIMAPIVFSLMAQAADPLAGTWELN
jgi:hypothetical protein